MLGGQEDLSPGMRCIKYLILAFNAIFVMTGILIIAVGTTIHSIYYNFDEFLETRFFSPATLLIVVGSFIFFIALLGCVGAARESTCLIMMFSLLLGFIFILEVSAGIAAFALQGEIRYTIRQNMLDSIGLYENNGELKETIDMVQDQLGCCGVDGPEDWKGILTISDTLDDDIVLPNSCCGVIVKDNNTSSCAEFYEDGCLRTLSFIVSQSAILLGGAALTVSIIQVIGVYFSYSLAKAIRTAKTERARRQYETLQNSYMLNLKKEDNMQMSYTHAASVDTVK